MRWCRRSKIVADLELQDAADLVFRWSADCVPQWAVNSTAAEVKPDLAVQGAADLDPADLYTRPVWHKHRPYALRDLDAVGPMRCAGCQV